MVNEDFRFWEMELLLENPNPYRGATQVNDKISS